jgi:hypothetical protein
VGRESLAQVAKGLGELGEASVGFGPVGGQGFLGAALGLGEFSETPVDQLVELPECVRKIQQLIRQEQAAQLLPPLLVLLQQSNQIMEIRDRGESSTTYASSTYGE